MRPLPTSRPARDGDASGWGTAIGAVADLGVLLPIVVLLVVTNGLSPTAVLLPVGLLYVLAGAVYRIPVPVQPMKAMAALSLGAALPPDVIAAGALAAGAVFLLLGATGLVDRCAAAMPLAVVRGVQLAVGLALLEVGYDLVVRPAPAFGPQPRPVMTALAAGALVLLFLRWPRAALAAATTAALVWVAASGGDAVVLGPTSVSLPDLDAAAVATAVVVLVVPQVPLTLTSSCIATADATRHYYGARSRRVSAGRLAMTLGTANLLAGGLSGMPVCHGSGGVTAHHRFGARTGTTPVLAGAGAVVVALAFGREFLERAAAFPLALLVALLVTAAIAHVRLLLDLARRRDRAVALAIGLASTAVGLAHLVAAGLAVWWLLPFLRGGPTMAAHGVAHVPRAGPAG